MVEVSFLYVGHTNTPEKVCAFLQDYLPWPFEVKGFSKDAVRVLVDSPPDVSEREVKEHTQNAYEALRAAHQERENKHIRRERP